MKSFNYNTFLEHQTGLIVTLTMIQTLVIKLSTRKKYPKGFFQYFGFKILWRLVTDTRNFI